MKSGMQPQIPQRPALFTEWTALLDVIILDALAIGVMIWIPAMIALCMTFIVVATIGLPIFFWLRHDPGTRK